MHVPSNEPLSRPMVRLAACAALLATLTACGYKGPLYMPPPPPDESLTVPPASVPAPDVADSPAAEPATTSPVKSQ